VADINRADIAPGKSQTLSLEVFSVLLGKDRASPGTQKLLHCRGFSHSPISKSMTTEAWVYPRVAESKGPEAGPGPWRSFIDHWLL